MKIVNQFLIVISIFGVVSANNLKNQFSSWSIEQKIVNGTLASLNETKHQVSVRRRLNDDYYFGTGHICGGSLIAPNVVLTAAHCFVNTFTSEYIAKEDFIVVMGNLNRFIKDNDTLIFDIRNISFAVKNFNLSSYEKDIALLFLNDTIPKDHPTVKPIIFTRTNVAEGTKCQATGWGYNENGTLAEYLMSVDVPLISSETCARDSLYTSALIKTGMFCAGYMDIGERDSCNGDSGGPLICNGKQTGIISWGEKCALPKLPGVYTDVAFYSKWIITQLESENIKVSSGVRIQFVTLYAYVFFLIICILL